jgi:hypothetical protein
VWTASRANADGAVCSFGASGGAAVTATVATAANGASTAVFRVLGVLSGFDDYRPAGQNTVGYDGAKVRQERQAQTGFDLRTTDVTCDYAHQVPPAASAQTLWLAATAADVQR